MVIAMAGSSGPQVEFARVLDTAQAAQASTAMFLPFVLGNLVGTLLVGVALLRSRTVPAWVAAGILLWPPLHMTGLVVGSEWFEVTGALLQGVGTAATGMTLLAPRSAHRGVPELGTG